MVVVKITASHFSGFAAFQGKSDTVTVSDAEKIDIAGGDDANALRSLVHVPVQPLADIAVAVKVVFTLLGGGPKHIGIVVGINTEAVVVVEFNGAFGMLIAIAAHSTSAFQDAAVLGVASQCIDYIVELCFEIIGFQIFSKVEKCRKKLCAATAEISTEMPDESCMGTYLMALGVAVSLLRLSHGSECHFHYRSSVRLFCFRSCSMNES